MRELDVQMRKQKYEDEKKNKEKIEEENEKTQNKMME